MGALCNINVGCEAPFCGSHLSGNKSCPIVLCSITHKQVFHECCQKYAICLLLSVQLSAFL